MRTITAMALGGALVYFLDPVSGDRRREMAGRRIQSLLNLGQRAAAESGRTDVAQAIGKVQRVAGGSTESPVIIEAKRSKAN